MIKLWEITYGGQPKWLWEVRLGGEQRSGGTFSYWRSHRQARRSLRRLRRLAS